MTRRYANEQAECLMDRDKWIINDRGDTELVQSGVDIAEHVRHESIKGYQTKVYKAGPQVHIHAYPIWGSKQAAGDILREIESYRKKEDEREAQRKGDQRRAAQKLDRLVSANFPEGTSYNMGVDYEVEPSPEQAEKDIADLIKALRKVYRKAGVELKYIYISQIITPTGRIRKRIHHHLVLSGGVDEKLIREAWKHGRTHLDPLQPDKNGVVGLTKYLAGHVHGKKRWVCSRNLVHPQPTKPRKPIAKRTAAKIAESYEWAREYFEKQYPAHVFCGMEVRYSDRVPGAYIYVRLRSRKAWQGWQRRERR